MATRNRPLKSPADKKLILREQVDCRVSLTEGLSQMFNDKTTSDVTLVVGKKRYYVHRVILAASSEYFRRMFYGGEWKETNNKEIILQETSAGEEVFEIFLRYFYTGFVNFSSETDAPDLLLLADKYNAKVKKNCSEYMISKIQTNGYLNTADEDVLDRALSWIPLCHQLKVDDMLEKCYFVISFNLEKACTRTGWSTISSGDISSICLLMSSHKAGRMSFGHNCDYTKYIAIQNWVVPQVECQEETIKELLSFVDFNKMAAWDLGKVEQSTLATDKSSSKIVHAHLYAAFRFKAFNKK